MSEKEDLLAAEDIFLSTADGAEHYRERLGEALTLVASLQSDIAFMGRQHRITRDKMHAAVAKVSQYKAHTYKAIGQLHIIEAHTQGLLRGWRNYRNNQALVDEELFTIRAARLVSHTNLTAIVKIEDAEKRLLGGGS